MVNISDLADTAFIKDYEILGYTFKRDTVKFKDSILIDNRQMFEVTSSVTEKINNLKIPLCCGRQFALTVNGNIVILDIFGIWFLHGVVTESQHLLTTQELKF